MSSAEESDLERIRRQKTEEYQQKMAREQAMEQGQAQAEMQLDSLLRQTLAPEAKARLSNVRLVNRELYYKAAQAIAYLAQSSRLSGKISEKELKVLLERLQPKKKELRIQRK